MTDLREMLKPCPLCGCEAEHIHVFDGEEIIRCIGHQMDDFERSCRCCVIARTKAKAIAAWNNRPESAMATGGEVGIVASIERLGTTCIDGGKCYHHCTDRCFRRECFSPFSHYLGPLAYEQPAAPACRTCGGTKRVPTVTGLLGGQPCPDCKPAAQSEREAWQPIESAQRDGTAVLVAEGKVLGEAWFDSEYEGWFWANCHHTDATGPGQIYPTHWMPLPEPPR